MSRVPILRVDEDDRRLREIGNILGEDFGLGAEALPPPTPVEQARANVVDALYAREQEVRRQANPNLLTAAQKAGIMARFSENPQYAIEVIRQAEQGDSQAMRQLKVNPARQRAEMRRLGYEGIRIKRQLVEEAAAAAPPAERNRVRREAERRVSEMDAAQLAMEYQRRQAQAAGEQQLVAAAPKKPRQWREVEKGVWADPESYDAATGQFAAVVDMRAKIKEGEPETVSYENVGGRLLEVTRGGGRKKPQIQAVPISQSRLEWRTDVLDDGTEIEIPVVTVITPSERPDGRPTVEQYPVQSGMVGISGRPADKWEWMKEADPRNPKKDRYFQWNGARQEKRYPPPGASPLSTEQKAEADRLSTSQKDMVVATGVDPDSLATISVEIPVAIQTITSTEDGKVGPASARMVLTDQAKMKLRNDYDRYQSTNPEVAGQILQWMRVLDPVGYEQRATRAVTLGSDRVKAQASEAASRSLLQNLNQKAWEAVLASDPTNPLVQEEKRRRDALEAAQ